MMVRCNIVKKATKGVVATLLAAVVFGAGFTGYTNKVEAATTTTNGNVPSKVEFVECTKAYDDYYSKDKKAPEAVDLGLDGEYLFAGWYQDDEKTAYTDDVPNVAKAKFVPAQVLSVKSQVDDADMNVNADTLFRIVSTVDSLDYKNVGFLIEATDSQGTFRQWKGQSTKVYEKFFADGSNREASAIFGGKSAYFFSYKLGGIPTENGLEEFKTSFYATPYWTTLDGTKVEGLTKCVHVEDYYNDYISVPVYLKSASTVKDIAAGILSVKYDSSKVTYVDCQNGSLLEEGMANGNAGTVKCVANIADINEKVSAKGMFINLRFKEVPEAQKPDGGYIFQVSIEDNSFCDIAEEFVSGVEAWDSFYY